MNEFELKFRLDAAAAQRWQQLFKAQGARRVHLRARYFDTDDGRLAAAHIALRLRLEGRRWVQTLKAGGDTPVHRLEHEVAVPAAAGQVPTLDLARHAGAPALDRLRDALGDASVESLVERHATDVWRSIVMLQDAADGSRIEAALDIGKVSAAERHVALHELELEHLDGSLAGLFRRAEEAVEAAREGGGAMWLSTVSKAEQGEQLRLGTTSLEAKARPLQLPAHADGATMLREVLRNTLDHMLPNLSQVAEGAGSAEHLHQARVGLRRLRTALRELAELSPAIDPTWESALARTFAQLGARRDAETVAEAVCPLLEAAGAPKTVWSAHVDTDTAAAVRAPEFQQALLQLLALAHAGDDAFAVLSHEALAQHLAQRLQRLHRQVCRDGRRFDSLPIARQHRVRKRLKRLRYLAEFATPLWPHKDVTRYVAALKPMQESLGWHADCAVAAEHFAEDARHDPAALFAAGYLKAHLQTTARAAHAALRDLRRTKRFWKALHA